MTYEKCIANSGKSVFPKGWLCQVPLYLVFVSYDPVATANEVSLPRDAVKVEEQGLPDHKNGPLILLPTEKDDNRREDAAHDHYGEKRNNHDEKRKVQLSEAFHGDSTIIILLHFDHSIITN